MILILGKEPLYKMMEIILQLKLQVGYENSGLSFFIELRWLNETSGSKGVFRDSYCRNPTLK